MHHEQGQTGARGSTRPDTRKCASKENCPTNSAIRIFLLILRLCFVHSAVCRANAVRSALSQPGFVTMVAISLVTVEIGS